MQQGSAGGGSRLRQQDRVLHKRRINGKYPAVKMSLHPPTPRAGRALLD